jgi:hypothetical protein
MAEQLLDSQGLWWILLAFNEDLLPTIQKYLCAWILWVKQLLFSGLHVQPLNNSHQWETFPTVGEKRLLRHIWLFHSLLVLINSVDLIKFWMETGQGVKFAKAAEEINVIQDCLE